MLWRLWEFIQGIKPPDHPSIFEAVKVRLSEQNQEELRQLIQGCNRLKELIGQELDRRDT